MKKSLYSFFVIFCSLKIVSQVGVPKRTILHTLAKNEILNSSEYYTFQTLNKNGFACIISDTIQKKNRFIFNGKVIFSADLISSNSFSNTILDLDFSNENGYSYKYKENGKFYVNYQGKIEGPFDDVTNEKYFLQRHCIYEKIPENFDFFYSLGGRWFSYFRGKAEMLEINENETENNSNCSFSYWTTKEQGKTYFSEIRCEKYRNKVGFDSLVTTAKNSKSTAFICVNNGKRYFCINDVISEPFDNNGYSRIQLIGDKYCYEYIKNGKRFINFNGKAVEIDCDYIQTYNIFDNGFYYFIYFKNEKQFININGKTFGPYDAIEYEERVYSNGNFGFVFKKNNEYFVNLNGLVSASYLTVNSLDYISNGKYKYLFSKEDGWVYENNNGKVTKTDDRKYGSSWVALPLSKRLFDYSINKYKITSNNKSHTLYTDLKYDYVVIDGRSYGKAPAIKAWYDETKNSFVWNAWEGKELVLYEFKLD